MNINRPLFGYKIHMKREVASLTKLMTLYTTLEVIRDKSINTNDFICTVSKYSSSIIGTSACLKNGDKIRLKDILFGI